MYQQQQLYPTYPPPVATTEIPSAPPKSSAAPPFVVVGTTKLDAAKVPTDVIQQGTTTAATTSSNEDSKQTILSIYPMQAPSPFADSHYILTDPLRLIRDNVQDGYGVVLKLESKQASMQDPYSGQKNHPPVYSVLSVLDPAV